MIRLKSVLRMSYYVFGGNMGNKNIFYTSMFLLVISVNIFAGSGITTPGQASFDYTTSQYPDNNFIYSPTWKFSTADQGYIIFDVQAGDEIDIGLSDTTDQDVYGYNIMIGTIDNTIAALDANGTYPDNSYEDANGILSVSAPRSFWMTLSNGAIALGTGRTIGQNQLISWNLASLPGGVPTTGITYFTLSSVTNANFSNIVFGSDLSTAPAAATTTTVVSSTGKTINAQQRNATMAAHNKTHRPSKSKHARKPKAPTKSEALQIREQDKSISQKGPLKRPGS